jgi:DNA-binding PadR family transcriptional regulator
MPRSSDPFTLEYVLLGILDQHPQHGYDLYRQLSALHGIRLIWNLKQSMLYALLDKLEADGLLVGQLIAGESRPVRREYHLTDEGRQAFLTWRQSPVQHGREMRQDFLARLYFASQTGLPAALTLIEQQKQVCLQWRKGMQAEYEAAAAAATYDRFVLSFRLSQVQSMLDWLESCARELAQP